MSALVEQLKTQLKTLSLQERAELARVLDQSLHEMPGSDDLLEAELQKRLQEIRSGLAAGEPAEKVFAEMRVKYPAAPGLRAITASATVAPDGSITLSELPFAEGQTVEVIVRRPAPQPKEPPKPWLKYRGVPIEYVDPFEPAVPPEDWEASR